MGDVPCARACAVGVQSLLSCPTASKHRSGNALRSFQFKLHRCRTSECSLSLCGFPVHEQLVQNVVETYASTDADFMPKVSVVMREVCANDVCKCQTRRTCGLGLKCRWRATRKKLSGMGEETALTQTTIPEQAGGGAESTRNFGDVHIILSWLVGGVSTLRGDIFT
eukprot:326607-Amphidinium_carterae.5